MESILFESERPAGPAWEEGQPAEAQRPEPSRKRHSAEAERAARERRLRRVGLLGLLVSVTFFQRFGIPIGQADLHLSFPLSMLCLLVMLFGGAIRLHLPRLLLFALVAGYLFLSLFVGSERDVSHNAFIMALVSYLGFVFIARMEEAEYRRLLRDFLNLALFFACVGILQFLAQFAISDPLLFTWEGTLPDDLLLLQWNTYAPIAYGSPIFRANGFFFLEPSTFSQLIGLAMVIEMLFFSIGPRFFVYAGALILSYSGTGLSLVLVFAPLAMLLKGRFGLLVAGAIAAGVLLLFADALNLGIITERAGEFSHSKSSGFQRFIAPFILLEEYLLVDPLSFLFGRGPGTLTELLGTARFEAFDPTWTKIIYEYGILGFLAFALFLGYCLFHASYSPLLSLALIYLYVMLGGGFLSAYITFLLVALGALPARPASGAAEEGPAP